MDKKIISPCISVCKTDTLTGYCYGCGRTNEEKKIWNSPESKDEWKDENLKKIKERLSGWQKKAFEKSYEYKKTSGISLIKKDIIEAKNS